MKIMFLNHRPRDPRDEEYHTRVQALLSGYASPGTQVEVCYPDDYPGAGVARTMDAQGVHSDLAYLLAANALVRKTSWAERNGYDAVIQSNNFDPGVETARLTVRIPVIGLARLTVHTAAVLADRIGVTVPFRGFEVNTRRMLGSYGLMNHITDIRALGLDGVPKGEEVAAMRPVIFERAIKVMRSLIRETGAECIVPLGGAVIPYIVSPDDLARELGVPVLNSKIIGIRFAEMCVRFGMSQSAITYPVTRLADEDFTRQANE